jgi:LuxR family transcriptional regulator, quorum-sensing system regulator BjaR1
VVAKRLDVGMGLGEDSASARWIGTRLFDYFEQVRPLKSSGPLVSAMARQLSNFGVEYFIIANTSRRPDAFARNVVTARLDAGWVRYFLSQRWNEHNLFISGAFNDYGPMFWHEIEASPWGGRQRSVIRDGARQFGIHEGICIPIPRASAPSAVAAFSGEKLDTSQAARVAMTVIALYSYGQLTRLASGPSRPHPKLTSREADCLAWVAKGKTDWEIGEILGISESTVHWYIEQAKRRLGVATRIQAVVGAIQEGAIVP